MLVILGASVGVMTASLRNQPRTTERSTDIQAARVAMANLTREIRQGATVTTATSTQLSLITNVAKATCGGAVSTVSRLCSVTYTCTAGTCTRTERNTDGTGSAPAVTMVTGLSSGSVFTYSPSATAPSYIGVQLVFPAKSGDDSITLTDGVTLRNRPAS